MPRRGFTLIELTVALMIAVVLFGAVVVSAGAITGSKARASAGELGGVIRSLYDTAGLTGRTCRLVFEMPPERPSGDDEQVTKYWAECAASAVTSRVDRERELDDDTRDRELKGREAGSGSGRGDDRFRSLTGDGEPSLSDLLAAEKNRVEDQARFSGFTSPQIESRELPAAVKLSVWTRHQRNAVSNGLAYLYFFPQGFTEKAQIYVRQGGNVWTITVAPLTGKTAVVAEELEVPRS